MRPNGNGSLNAKQQWELKRTTAAGNLIFHKSVNIEVTHCESIVGT
jgi:hypothetical protein